MHHAILMEAEQRTIGAKEAGELWDARYVAAQYGTVIYHVMLCYVMLCYMIL